MKIEIKYLVQFKAYFHVFSIFLTGCLSAFRRISAILKCHKNPIRFIAIKFNPSRIKFRQYI